MHGQLSHRAPPNIIIITHKLQRMLNADAHCHRHLEVWSRPGSDTARWTSLARRRGLDTLQACSDSSSVSEQPRTTVSVGVLHTGLWCWHAAAPAFLRSSSADSAVVPANIYSRRAFSVTGPMVWNTLQDFIRDPTISADCFKQKKKKKIYFPHTLQYNFDLYK